MSRGPRDPVDAGAPWPTRTGLGVFAARGRRAGGRPRDPARPGSAGGFGSVAGDRPGTTTEGARRTGEPASGGPRAGGGGRDRAERVGLSWRRSVSARRADPPSASTSAREELRGPCRVCTVLTGSGRQDRPRPPITPPGPARPPRGRSRTPPRGREGILAPGGPSRFDAGAGDFREDLAAAGLPAGGPRGGPHAPRVRRMRAPESGRRRAGQDGAHHRARQGEPGPRSARTRRGLPPPPAQTGAGWSTSPACRPGRGSAAPPSSRGLFSRQIVGWATSSRTGHRQRGRRPRAGDPAAQAPRRPMPDRPGPPQRPRIQVTCPSPTPDDSSTRAPVASAGAVGSSYDNAAAEALGKSLQARGPFWRDGPWKDRDDPRGRHRPVGELVQPHPTPPRQPRRPLTRRRRTPLPSQPHHHHRRPARHGITTPPQNPGRSRPRGNLPPH